MSKVIKGQCLCGAVKVTATTEDEPNLFACHCEMCRRQNSALLLGVEVDQDSIAVEGPVKLFRSSEWAQRAFCDTCGSTLWYGLLHDGSRNLAAGLFNDLGGKMKQEYFCDQALGPVTLTGDHQKLTRAETFALFAPDEGDAT